jgi:hypothetical protein
MILLIIVIIEMKSSAQSLTIVSQQSKLQKHIAGLTKRIFYLALNNTFFSLLYIFYNVIYIHSHFYSRTIRRNLLLRIDLISFFFV